VDTASLALVLMTMTLASFAPTCLRVATGLSFLDGGVDRIRNVVIRAGDRGCGID